MMPIHESRREPTLPEFLATPAVKSYLFVGVTGVVIYYFMMLQREAPIGGLACTVIAGLGLFFRWTSAPILFLILTSYLVFDPDFGGLREELYGLGMSYGSAWQLPSFGVDEILLAASILAYLMAHHRLLSFMHKGMPDDPAPLRRGQIDPPIPRRPTTHFTERELGLMLLQGLAMVLAGIVMWWLLVTVDRSRRFSATWGFVPAFGRIVLFGWALGTILMLSISVLRYVRLLRMSRLQARMIMADTFWEATRREQERLYRWRRWHEERLRREREKTERPAEPKPAPTPEKKGN